MSDADKTLRLPTPRKILLVDDDALVRETVRMALRHGGFDVRVAEDPARAPELAGADPPDLVLMDLYMPGMDGLELCRRMKKDPRTQAVPVVLFTGSDEEIDKLSGKEAGAFEYITKPIDARKLVAKIKSILDAR